MKYNYNLFSFKTSFLFNNLKVFKLLNKYLVYFSNSNIATIIKKNFLYFNKFLIKKNFKLISGFFINFILFNFLNKIYLKFIKFYLPIIYEDNYFLVLNKPYNVIIHSNYFNLNNTLVNYLLYYYSFKILNLFRLGILHRLDKNTTGLIIITKFSFLYINFLKQLKFNIINKYYFSIILNRTLNSFKVFGKFKYLKYTRSNFFLFDTVNFNRFWFSFLKCNLVSGRTHQIRIHLNFIKNYILCDNIYNKFFINNIIFKNYLNRIALHSYFISFFHPIFNLSFRFNVGLYNDIYNFYKLIKLKF